MNRVRWLAWILGVAVAVAGVPETALANKHLKRAHKAYDNLKYELVIKHLKRAVKIAKSPEEEVEIYQFLGRMYVMYDKDDLARESFVEVLKRNPTFELPDTESPKILGMLEEARAGAASATVNNSGETPPDDGTTPDDTAVTEEIVATPTDETPDGTNATDPPDPMLTTTTEADSAFYETWWFWTAVGVVVVGAAAGATLAVTLKPGPPPGDFDPVPFP